MSAVRQSSEASGPPSVDAPARVDGRSRAAELRRALSFRRISIVYILIAIFVLFALWVPETFLTTTTLKSLLNQQALTAILALGLMVALSAGMFDLAIGTELGVGAILVAWLIGIKDVDPVFAILIAILAGGLVGIASGTLITRVGIDSFIATLGISSILTAAIRWISGGNEILNLKTGFSQIASTELLGLQLPVFYMLAIGLVVYYVLERTAIGRRVYATGGNREAAGLSGIRTSRVIMLSLIACGAVAALAGVLVSASLDAGDPSTGPDFLLPAFSAVFLGSTQFKPGRFNVLGTVVSVYVLATGVKGLQLAGAPIWIPELFNGAALLIAVGMAKTQRARVQTAAIRRIFGGFGRGGPPPGEAAGATTGGAHA